LRRADILKLNEEELSKIAAMLRLPGELAQQVVSLSRQYDIEEILVTCGDKGAWHIDRNGKAIHASAEETELADIVGAGDGFSAVMMLGMLREWPAELSLSRANAFAAAVCGIRGAAPPDPSFYEPFLSEWQCTSS
jgi:fructokinase